MAIGARLVWLVLAGVLLSGISRVALVGYAVLLLCAIAIDLALAARIRDLVLRRDPSAPIRQGERGQSVLRIANGGRRPFRGLLRDAWVPSAGATPREQHLRLPAGGSRAMTTALAPTRRGERAAASVTVRSFGPLQVAARQRRLPVAGTVAVLPAFPSRRLLPEKLTRLRQIEGTTLVRQRGPGSEFDSLREYVVGDDVRSIDWRATARAGDVVVRTWRPERDRHVLLAIDTGRTSAARIGNAPRLDAALDAALLLGAVAARAGDRVGLVAADIELRARLRRVGGDDIMTKLVAALTRLEPALVETDPQLLAGEVLRSAGRRSLVVLFTALDAGPAESGLVPAARAIAAHHQLVVASVADPRVHELARTRDDAAATYTAATAELDLLRRRHLTERLSQLGIAVVDADPGHFASSVTDRYLDLKAAGRL